MRKLVGVRFRDAGRSTYFDPQSESYDVGERVVVDMGEGEEIAIISVPLVSYDDEKLDGSPKTIKRKATKEDLEKLKTNLADEKEAYKLCLEKIIERELPMKLVKAEYTFSRNRLIFYFTAEGRVDFRELVKDLAGLFHTRIELRQIGVRDETKILGGIGMCGRPFCCRTFLTEFAPVSIKMAKEQHLSLNPTKISGVCGRLMCCLKNEEETYEHLNSLLPSKGDTVKLKDGKTGTVYSINVLKQLITVLFEENDEKETAEYHVDEIVKRFSKKSQKQENASVEEDS